MVRLSSMPQLSKRCNCGPTILAGFLEITGESAITIIEKAINKKWPGFTNVGHLRKALESLGYKMIRDNIFNNTQFDKPNNHDPHIPYFVFIQITGSWMGKGWRSEYNYTHWALLYETYILDVNNRKSLDDIRPMWLPIHTWKNEVIPGLIETLDGDDWFIKSSYRIEGDGFGNCLSLIDSAMTLYNEMEINKNVIS